jgi:hypothetical protein
MVVVVAGPDNSTPRGPAIDVFFNYGGGHCQTHWQHPLGGPSIDVLQQVIIIASIFWQHLPGGHCGRHYCYGVFYWQDISWQSIFSKSLRS